MSRDAYLRALIACYLEQSDTPKQASTHDWAIAADLYNRGVQLDDVLHAIRLAALRRANATTALPKISSLAYYRRVLEQLRPDDLDERYRRFIEQRHRQLHQDSLNESKEKTSTRSRNAAPSPSR